MTRPLETRSVHTFYVIAADRDGMRKYISKDFPRLFQYTIKISKARRFQTEEQAKNFIRSFNEYGKYIIKNPVVTKMERCFTVADLVQTKSEDVTSMGELIDALKRFDSLETVIAELKAYDDNREMTIEAIAEYLNDEADYAHE